MPKLAARLLQIPWLHKKGYLSSKGEAAEEKARSASLASKDTVTEAA